MAKPLWSDRSLYDSVVTPESRELHRKQTALYAAAPELLAFAEAFLQWHEGPGRTDSPLAEQARAAIRRARGEG